MKRASRICAALCAALCAVAALSGCVDSATKITVKADGSGTIEKTIVLGSSFVAFLGSMGMGGDAAELESSMLSAESLEADAERMGEGVTFVSAEKVTTPGGNGYRALYRFNDINNVRLDQSPTADVDVPSVGAPAEQPSAPEVRTFRFVKGNPASLTIISPQPEAGEAGEGDTSDGDTAEGSAEAQASPEEAQAMMELLRPLYSELRMAFSVEVQGTIARTNAVYVEGSTVTIMDVDFGDILADDAMFQALSSRNAQSMTDIQDIVDVLPGVRIDTQQTITIEFR